MSDNIYSPINLSKSNLQISSRLFLHSLLYQINLDKLHNIYCKIPDDLENCLSKLHLITNYIHKYDNISQSMICELISNNQFEI